jgi:hypothetical protein
MKGKVILLLIVLSQIWLFFDGAIIIFDDNNETTNLELSALDSWNRTWEKHDITGEDIALDSNEDIFIVGTNYWQYSNNTMCLIKFDKLGNFQWDYIWDGGGENARATALELDTDDNIYVTGNYDGQIALVKLNSSGQIVWEKSYSYSGTGYDIALDQLGNIYLGCSIQVGNNYDVFLMILNSTGDIKQTRTWDAGNDYDYHWVRAIMVDSMGDIYITGDAASSPDDENNNAFLLKYDNSGQLQWYKIWGDDYDEEVGDIALDSLGNIYVSGYSQDWADWGAESENFLLKYDTSGILQEEVIWKKRVNPAEAYVGVILNNTESIYITESTPRYTGDVDICVIKCDNSLKFEEIRLWGEPDKDDVTKGFVIDSMNNIYLIGESGYNKKLVLIKNPEIFIPVPNLLPILIPVLILVGVSVVILNLVVYEKYLKRTSKSIKLLSQVDYRLR